jgi:small subunit ribosomal protein S6
MSDPTNTYEAMFILPSGQADLETAAEPVRTVLGRYGAEVLALKQWDERRLAYEIGAQRRGLYVLAFFKVDPTRVAEIEHDCQLDERILRALILRRHRLGQQEIDASTPAQTVHHRGEGPEDEAQERPRRRHEQEEDPTAEAQTMGTPVE